jgi:hypothetical protein
MVMMVATAWFRLDGAGTEPLRWRRSLKETADQDR